MRYMLYGLVHNSSAVHSMGPDKRLHCRRHSFEFAARGPLTFQVRLNQSEPVDVFIRVWKVPCRSGQQRAGPQDLHDGVRPRVVIERWFAADDFW
jgi:hypothetical protein